MKKLMTVATIMTALFLSSQVIASDHGYIKSVRHDIPNENVYRVNIEKIDGSEKGMSANHRVKPGKHNINLSLVFNSKWAPNMEKTGENIYYKSVEIDIEAGKTYTIGAKVDTNASADAVNDGSFWEPTVYKIE